MCTFRSIVIRTRRIKYLSYPRERIDWSKPEWRLTTALKHYRPTKRIIQLSKPVNRGIGEVYTVSSEKKLKNTISYEPSQRLLELAIPPVKPPDNRDKRKNPFRIRPKALRAKPTARLLELAEPKEHDSFAPLNPWSISKSALRAKASQRIEMLSKPKKYN
ncbi:uncharacterized protein LOC105215464 [Zeugodacus cucurbitae]|uniref:Testicular haploid expressed gene protein-like n=1 Tax=Zeugodacus cucurbitae TaxID=28588 RepID=A0A0A1WMF6_ZEUCU|nr:uncharacterized protein LOC105215464 [Zeugodacus cucurbitae]